MISLSVDDVYTLASAWHYERNQYKIFGQAEESDQEFKDRMIAKLDAKVDSVVQDMAKKINSQLSSCPTFKASFICFIRSTKFWFWLFVSFNNLLEQSKLLVEIEGFIPSESISFKQAITKIFENKLKELEVL
jgi:hypothetical protein